MAQKPKISLPKSWPTRVKSAILHVIALAPYATAYTRAWAANSLNARMLSQSIDSRISSVTLSNA